MLEFDCKYFYEKHAKKSIFFKEITFNIVCKLNYIPYINCEDFITQTFFYFLSIYIFLSFFSTIAKVMIYICKICNERKF